MPESASSATAPSASWNLVQRSQARTCPATAAGSASHRSPSYHAEIASRASAHLTDQESAEHGGKFPAIRGNRNASQGDYWDDTGGWRSPTTEGTTMPQHPTTRQRGTRTAVRTLAAVGAVGLVLVAAPGWAHVTVDPDTATQGGYAVLSLRVPTESDSASTTKVQVFLPQDHPLASVSVRPHPGWQAKVVTRKLATPLTTDDGQVTQGVYSITWTSDGPQDALKPGQYDDFDISVGPLPDVSTLSFKTLQTYSDGTVVRWIDPPAASGQPEPEHPTPTLTLLPAPDNAAGPGVTSSDSSSSSSGRATTALALSAVAILLGLGALAAALLRRRPA